MEKNNWTVTSLAGQSCKLSLKKQSSLATQCPKQLHDDEFPTNCHPLKKKLSDLIQNAQYRIA